MDEFIQKISTFMKAQQQAEECGQQEFICPPVRCQGDMVKIDV